jgi:Cu-Zn family superoxide dismutase
MERYTTPAVTAFGGAWPVRALLVVVVYVSIRAALPASSVFGQPLQAAATADVRDRLSRIIGTVTLREEQDSVHVTGTFRNLPAGPHGLHIDNIGRCLSPAFSSAGGIFNPNGKQHGLRNPAGPQVGDLPVLMVGADGTAAVDMVAVSATLGSAPTSLLGGNGTALVIHAGDDDQLTDPDGNAGDRIACGVILPSDSGALSATALARAATIVPTGVGPAPATTTPPTPPVAAGQGNARDQGVNASTSLLAGALGVVLIATGVLVRRRRHSR